MYVQSILESSSLLIYWCSHSDEELPRPKRKRTGSKTRRPQEEADTFPAVQPHAEMGMDMDWGFGMLLFLLELKDLRLTRNFCYADNNADVGMFVDENGGFRHSSEVGKTDI